MDPASASSVGARTALITLAISVARPVEFTGQPLVMPRALASLTCDAMALGTSAIAGFSTRARLSRGHARDSLNAETVPTSATLIAPADIGEICMNSVYPPAIMTARLMTARASETILRIT